MELERMMELKMRMIAALFMLEIDFFKHLRDVS